MPDREKACQCSCAIDLPARWLARGFLSPKEHRMGGHDTKFHRRACLIDACGALTAMDKLTGGEADRVQILRAVELT